MVDEASVLQPGRLAPSDEVAGAPYRVTTSTVREAILVLGFLALLGTLVFGPHVMHGGFYLDDWSDSAATLYPRGGSGVGGVLAQFANFLSYTRPLLILFLPLKYAVFGAHMKYLLAFAAALAVATAGLTYAVLRVLRVPWYHAGLIAALTVVYPWYDSTRLWDSASLASLAIIFALAGLLVALMGLSRNSWRLHVGAALLYLMSVLTYEITLPLIAAAGILYVFRAGWQRARIRWAVDIAVIGLGALWDLAHTPRSESGLSHNLTHLWGIFTSSGELLGRTLDPLGPQPHTTLSLGVLAAICVAGVAMLLASRTPRTARSGWGVREWLILGAGGIVVAALGWTMFIPANVYYTPSIYGFTNRVNGLAGFGLVIAVYAAFGLVGSLVGELLAKRREAAIAVTLVLGVALGAAYVHVLERHARLWDAAFRAESLAYERLKADLPRLPHGTTVFTSNYPAYLTLGVPILATTLDVKGMVQLRYGDGTLEGYPVTSELKLVCGVSGIRVEGGSEPAPSAPYGTARLLDLSTGRHSDPRSRRACLAMKGNYRPGPLYLSSAY